MNDANTSAKGHLFLLARVYGSRHGGSIYAEELVNSFLAAGLDVTVAAGSIPYPEQLPQHPSFHTVLLPNFFSRGLRKQLGRFYEAIWLVALTLRDPRVSLLIQGDLPRLTYLFLQLFRPVTMLQQDGILSCPANCRFLPKSRTICRKPLGWSCLDVHKSEGCFGQISLMRRSGRILFRMRDRWLMQNFQLIIVNSNYIGSLHRPGTDVLYPPLLLGTMPVVHSLRSLSKLVFCGHLDTPVKGCYDALHILAELPAEYSLEVIGDGKSLGACQQLADTLSISKRVKFHGWLEAARRDTVTRSAGALLMPSLCDEAFGMVGIEAFAQGTPVVAYEVGGIPEWCEVNAGITVPCGDIHAAAEAVLKITRNKDEWSKYSARAQQVAEKYSANRFRTRAVELLTTKRP